MKKLFALASAVTVVGLLSAGSVLAEVTVKAVAFIPKTHPVMVGSRMWVDEVNESMKGEFQINYVGGPEIIPRFEQFEAIRSGVMDMGFIVGADMQDTIPEAIGMVLSKLDPSQERESGFFDYMDNLFQTRMNTKLIGRVQMSPFFLWMKKKPETLADLKGVKMRTGGLYDRLMRNFGMIPVTMNSPEVFTALERGVVEGFGWPPTGVVKLGWAKHIGYVIDLPFFEWSNMYGVMNLDKWKGLGARTQKKIMDSMIAFEPGMVAHYRAMNEDEWRALDEAGVERITFSDAENKEYLDTAYNLEWVQLAKKIGAAEVEKLRALTGN